MYFANFPVTRYQLTLPTKGKPAEYVPLVDITRNVRFKKEVLDNIVLYDFYTMSDDDTVELVSEKLYNTPYYQWVLMLLNDRFDYIKDLPLPSRAFQEYINQKYPEQYIFDTYKQLNGAQGLLVELQDDSKKSVEIDATVLVNNTPMSVISVTEYDSTLDTNVKKFINKNTGVYIDDTSKINFGAIPSIRTVSAYEKEDNLNERKRRIKVISRDLLSTVLKNFRELM